jgi:hypothetical protein
MLQINDVKKIGNRYFEKYVHILNTKERKRDGVITISFNDKLLDYKMTVPKIVFDIIQNNILSYYYLVKYYKQEHTEKRIYVVYEADNNVIGYTPSGNGPIDVSKYSINYQPFVDIEKLEELINNNNCIPEIEYIRNTFVESRLGTIKIHGGGYSFSINLCIKRIHYTIFTKIQKIDTNLYNFNIRINSKHLYPISSQQMTIIDDQFIVDSSDKVTPHNIERVIMDYIFKIIDLTKLNSIL